MVFLPSNPNVAEKPLDSIPALLMNVTRILFEVLVIFPGPVVPQYIPISVSEVKAPSYIPT